MGRFIDRFCPDMCVEHITDVDVAALQALGFEAIMLDLDNTLLPWKSSIVPNDRRQWIDRAKRLGLKLCVVSNTHNPRRLNAIAGELGIPAISRALKPRSHGFDRAVKMLDCEHGKCIVIGDQVMTDMLGGNLAGMYTVLVKPMHHREFIGTKLSRVIEWFILRRLGKDGRLGTKTDAEKSEIQETK